MFISNYEESRVIGNFITVVAGIVVSIACDPETLILVQGSIWKCFWMSSGCTVPNDGMIR